MTRYTEKELRAEAVHAIRADAAAAKCRARCLGYSLLVGEPVGTVLVAHGQRTDQPFRPGAAGYCFDVNVAI